MTVKKADYHRKINRGRLQCASPPVWLTASCRYYRSCCNYKWNQTRLLFKCVRFPVSCCCLMCLLIWFMALRCHVSLHEAMTAILSLCRRRARGKARDDMTHRHVGSRGPREKQESYCRCFAVCLLLLLLLLFAWIKKNKIKSEN